MHLDTVFTIIGEKEFMVYSGVMGRAECTLYSAPYEKDKDVEGPMDFERAMRKIGIPKMNRVECGHETRLFQSREQWTDGANLFAIAPGVLLGYERNEESAKALGAQNPGYEYLKA